MDFQLNVFTNNHKNINKLDRKVLSELFVHFRTMQMFWKCTCDHARWSQYTLQMTTCLGTKCSSCLKHAIIKHFDIIQNSVNFLFPPIIAGSLPFSSLDFVHGAIVL